MTQPADPSKSTFSSYDESYQEPFDAAIHDESVAACPPPCLPLLLLQQRNVGPRSPAPGLALNCGNAACCRFEHNEQSFDLAELQEVGAARQHYMQWHTRCVDALNITKSCRVADA
jgi:hypothetical protein